MKKIDIITLKNGVKVVFLLNKKVHYKEADLIIKYGGDYNEFLIDEKKYHMHDGIAHFIEHLLIEQSKFGNMLINFNNDSIITNGITSNKTTNYYINTVHDFEKNLVKLIEFVNIPNFNKDNIEYIKPAIIEEIRRSKDNPFRNLYSTENTYLFNKNGNKNVIGTEKDIKNITYDDVKKCYDVFYQFDNQYIFIEGNVNKKKIIKLINKTYNNINKDKLSFEILKPTQTDEITKKNIVVYDNVANQYTELCFKINIKDFKNFEKVKLTFYINYFISYKFGSSSAAYKELIDKKISNTTFNYNSEFNEDYLIIRIGTRTEKEDILKKLILKHLKIKKVSKKYFETMKRNVILELINREERNYELDTFIPNVIDFDYYDLDKIEDVQNQTYQDFIKTINKLNFDKFCVALLKNKDESKK